MRASIIDDQICKTVTICESSYPQLLVCLRACQDPRKYAGFHLEARNELGDWLCRKVRVGETKVTGTSISPVPSSMLLFDVRLCSLCCRLLVK